MKDDKCGRKYKRQDNYDIRSQLQTRHHRLMVEPERAAASQGQRPKVLDRMKKQRIFRPDYQQPRKLVVATGVQLLIRYQDQEREIVCRPEQLTTRNDCDISTLDVDDDTFIATQKPDNKANGDMLTTEGIWQPVEHVDHYLSMFLAQPRIVSISSRKTKGE